MNKKYLFVLFGLILAVAMAAPAKANAQVSFGVSVGTPYAGGYVAVAPYPAYRGYCASPYYFSSGYCYSPSYYRPYYRGYYRHEYHGHYAPRAYRYERERVPYYRHDDRDYRGDYRR
ncbi:hypothetical protein Acid345_0493 [Candidatus Koribacter versatilis Ellin345]|uniref:Uncharacterized protein n=1 Tax=Koribacter versatilis (strain Ellin345) TaxID=204669 RepID=Q1IUF2_KORVE|nr:hypothetical protein [Candidatus Koribacter versatilis]ABF39498.1 hypothetical protein Acid345_0493 [Candidatus Koribacter versatilis Ellin345]